MRMKSFLDLTQIKMRLKSFLHPQRMPKTDEYRRTMGKNPNGLVRPAQKFAKPVTETINKVQKYLTYNEI